MPSEENGRPPDGDAKAEAVAVRVVANDALATACALDAEDVAVSCVRVRVDDREKDAEAVVVPKKLYVDVALVVLEAVIDLALGVDDDDRVGVAVADAVRVDDAVRVEEAPAQTP